MTDTLSTTFAALADPTRREILQRLARGEATVKELLEPFDITAQAVSRHLRVLEQAGLIRRGRTGKWRPCTLEPAPLGEATGWIGHNREMWLTRFERLDAAVGRLRPDTTRPGPREFTVGRVFDAPRRELFRAWIEPERLAGWFGPHGVSTPLSRMSIDARPGGHWRMSMVSEADGTEFPSEMTYHEVVEPERLVFGWGNFDATPTDEGTAVVTVHFTELHGQCVVQLRQSGSWSDARNANVRTGWSETLERLDHYTASAYTANA
ncbi:metalloregulator ArsR/SmtB family transcription factor [Dactylosporangium sp. CS-047395]|uniref:metalloregulator ArsR/SmtB family transcription factor n=1 Tax=Dactylosporangium sp. CS-047395 TaxID=3239936 RepID=UPI003D8DFCCC